MIRTPTNPQRIGAIPSLLVLAFSCQQEPGELQGEEPGDSTMTGGDSLNPSGGGHVLTSVPSDTGGVGSGGGGRFGSGAMGGGAVVAAGGESGVSQSGLRPEHLIIVGIDGGGAEWTTPDNMPLLFSMAAGIDGPVGALWNEELDTSSSPNWASMITGTGIPIHGVTTNSWQIGYSDLPPTIIAALHAAEPQAKVGLVQDWEHLGRLFHEDTWDWEISPMENQKEVVDEAIDLIVNEKPRLLFLHFDDVDNAGHSFGWGTTETLKRVADADVQIGRLRDALVAEEIWDKTVMMIVADHGGAGEEHKDPNNPAVRRVPLLIVGGQVQSSDLAVGDDLRIYDVAPTVTSLLGVPAPDEWIGTSRL